MLTLLYSYFSLRLPCRALIFLRTYPAALLLWTCALIFLRTPATPHPALRFALLLWHYFSSHLPCCGIKIFFFALLPCCDIIFYRTPCCDIIPLYDFHLPCCDIIFLRALLLRHYFFSCSCCDIILSRFTISTYPAVTLIFFRTFTLLWH